MPCVPLSQALNTNCFKNIRLVATDMDGTLTQRSKFTPQLLQAFEQLAQANIQVLIVTGRSAGWVSGLVHYLPVAGAIAENGGLFYSGGSKPAVPLTPITNIALHRQKLAQTFEQLQRTFPQLQESHDNIFRLTDWTFDIQGLTLEEVAELDAYCQAQGWGFTYSNVQCHIKLLQQNKAAGLLQVLRDSFPDCSPEQVLTVGDSPNDESLFDPARFPVSVGVANIQHYTDQLTYWPAYITEAPEGEGFCELVHFLLS